MLEVWKGKGLYYMILEKNLVKYKLDGFFQIGKQKIWHVNFYGL